jgi:hypothetical protein
VNRLSASLQSAALLAVKQPGFKLTDINLAHWATTYRSTIDEVEEAIKIALNGGRKLPEEVAATASKPIPTEEVDE